MERDQQFYLLLMSRLLIELRNLEEKDLHYASKLAYIFHNVPGTLNYNFNPQTEAELHTAIHQRAQYFGVETWINEWEESAAKRIEYDRERATTGAA